MNVFEINTKYIRFYNTGNIENVRLFNYVYHIIVTNSNQIYIHIHIYKWSIKPKIYGLLKTWTLDLSKFNEGPGDFELSRVTYTL